MILYLKLFWSFFKIGLFGFGGGYGMLSLIQNEVVEKNHWLTTTEFTDIVAISQVTPGPIGINSATYVGYSTTGSILGAVVATLAVVLPSFILVLTICHLFNKFKQNKTVSDIMSGLRPAVIGIIAAAALLLMTPENFEDWKSWIFFAATFALCKWGKIHPILVIIIAGIVSGFVYYT